MLSFPVEEFYGVLESYNLAIWPLQVLAYVLVVVTVVFSLSSSKYSHDIVAAILSFFWLFTGIVFCFVSWAPSHVFGTVFGIFCVLQGLLFLFSIRRSAIFVGPPALPSALVGIVITLYAAIGYQVFGTYLGHDYPRFFAVGLVPCPTTICTFGIFFMSKRKIPMRYLVIPFMISIGGVLAVYNGIYEDIGLVVVGVGGTILLMRTGSYRQRDV